MNWALPLISHAVPHVSHCAVQPSRREAPFLPLTYDRRILSQYNRVQAIGNIRLSVFGCGEAAGRLSDFSLVAQRTAFFVWLNPAATQAVPRAEGIAARAKPGNANSESVVATGRLAAGFARRAAEII
jgi:hypothetical protein